MTLIEELKVLLKARIALINIVTFEEDRLLADLTQLTAGRDWAAEAGLYVWDHADQFECLKPAAAAFDVEQTASVDTILTVIQEYDGNATFVLRDFHHAWEARRSVSRKLRNLRRQLEGTPGKNVILLTPCACLPDELQQDVYSLELPKPDADGMAVLLDQTAGAAGGLDGISDALRDRIIKAALGLSSNQATRVFRLALASSTDGRLDETCMDLITAEKCRIIRESGALEFYPYTELEQNVGGLDVLKQWLRERSSAFTEEAARYGLDRPKGLALIGIPGTGKSLCARLAAGLWHMPLLRLDMGAVFESLLGHTERNLRDAIQIAELVSPSILWIDEIEKAFAGSQGDRGTATRVLGSFLTWMQERTRPVFVIATANNIDELSPELLRRGRFDEVFFLDLPTQAERREIISVHLRQRGYHQVAQRFDLDALAERTEGFVGAELEAVVRDAMFPAFQDGQRELETGDLEKAIGELVPLAKSHGRVVQHLRQWVINGLARNASQVGATEEVTVEEFLKDASDDPFFGSMLN